MNITHGTHNHIRAWRARLDLWHWEQRNAKRSGIPPARPCFPDPRDADLRDRGIELEWRAAVARRSA